MMNLRIALRSLADAPRRNLFALAGLVLGVGAVVAMLALTLIVRDEAMRQFSAGGVDVLAIRKGATAGAEGVRRPPRIDLELAQALGPGVPGLELVAPLLERRHTLALDGRTYTADLLGVTGGFAEINDLPLAAGRALSDLDRFQPFVVLGRDQAAALGGTRAPAALLGRELVIEGRVLTIVGVLGPASAIKLHAGDLDKAVLVPATTFGRLFPASEIGVIYARTRPGADPGTVAEAVRVWFAARAEGLGVQVTSAEQLVAEMARQLRLFTIFLGAAGALSFLLGGAAMFNSLLVGVSERRREIGLRRAVGAMRGDIHAQFLYEALALCATGGALGVGLGAALTAGVTRFTGWTFELPPAVGLLGFGIAIAVGLAAGSIPAWQAARLDPAAAIKAGG